MSDKFEVAVRDARGQPVRMYGAKTLIGAKRLLNKVVKAGFIGGSGEVYAADDERRDPLYTVERSK